MNMVVRGAQHCTVTHAIDTSALPANKSHPILALDNNQVVTERLSTNIEWSVEIHITSDD